VHSPPLTRRSAAFLLASCKELRTLALEANVWEVVRGVLVKAYGPECPGADPAGDAEARRVQDLTDDDWAAEPPSASRCPYPLAAKALEDRHGHMIEQVTRMKRDDDEDEDEDERPHEPLTALADETPLADILGRTLYTQGADGDSDYLHIEHEDFQIEIDYDPTRRFTSRALLSELLRARYTCVPALRRGLGLDGEEAWARFLCCWSPGEEWAQRTGFNKEPVKMLVRSRSLRSALEVRGARVVGYDEPDIVCEYYRRDYTWGYCNNYAFYGEGSLLRQAALIVEKSFFTSFVTADQMTQELEKCCEVRTAAGRRRRGCGGGAAPQASFCTLPVHNINQRNNICIAHQFFKINKI
jgi:hypothetical protein